MKKLVLMFGLTLVACAHNSQPKEPKPVNPAEVDRIRSRAAAELSCAEENVTVEVLEHGNTFKPWTFVAKGCDKTATYLSRMGTIIRN